jgi:hypothetical protein
MTDRHRGRSAGDWTDTSAGSRDQDPRTSAEVGNLGTPPANINRAPSQDAEVGPDGIIQTGAGTNIGAVPGQGIPDLPAGSDTDQDMGGAMTGADTTRSDLGAPDLGSVGGPGSGLGATRDSGAGQGAGGSS